MRGQTRTLVTLEMLGLVEATVADGARLEDHDEAHASWIAVGSC